jgi:xanthosine utilization system XapX-like protein
VFGSREKAMSPFEEESDPRPGIRAVLLTGFCAGNVCGLLYALLTGHLFEPWWSDAYALLALAGTVAAVGLMGTMVGALVGLSARLLLHGAGLSQSWWPPVLVSGIASGSLGIATAAFLVGALFESAK